jgi:alanine dehydrogenase
MYFDEADNIGTQPMRTLLRPSNDSLVLVMPAHSKFLKRLSVKVISEFKNNPHNFGLPVQGGKTLLIDAKNSESLAILDSSMLTSIRTGAVSGLATKILARKDSKVVGIIGSGQQARTMLEAICAVRRISNAKVYSPISENAERYGKEMSEKLRIQVNVAKERSLATKEADIIILATNSSNPVVSWRDVPEGCHINSVGTLPERRELDDETIANSKLFVDFRDGVLKEAGDFMHAIESGIIPPHNIKADLSELVRGSKAGRDSEKQVTLFKSVGFALQDVYAASSVYDSIASHKIAD